MTISEIQTVKTALHQLAVQANSLAMGLQNAAPPQVETSALGSVQYLKETAVQLEHISQEISS